jgi:hypothetical protein
MKRALSLILIQLFVITTIQAQSPAATAGAVNPVQLSQPGSATPPPAVREFKIPAGTPLEIETAFTVNSQYVRPEELISFRVLVPVKVDGVTVIEKYSLVTGRVVEAKRGRHWGRAGKLSWIMQDVVAVDLTRVPLQAVRDTPASTNRVAGTSHGGELAAHIAIAAPLMLFAAPLALTAGFKRGENALLPEGKRFIVYVAKDTTLNTSSTLAEPPPPKP